MIRAFSSSKRACEFFFNEKKKKKKLNLSKILARVPQL